MAWRNAPLRHERQAGQGYLAFQTIDYANLWNCRAPLNEKAPPCGEAFIWLVAAEFYSDYCEPCKKTTPKWRRLRANKKTKASSRGGKCG